jgi:glutaredoxin
MIKIIRKTLGSLILFIDFVTRPKQVQRDEFTQRAVNDESQALQLYQFELCPFCIKTRRTIRRLNLNIMLKDAKKDLQTRQELLAEGGKVQVPCLRIEENDEVTWLYESNEINTYLDKRFLPNNVSPTAPEVTSGSAQ